MELWFDGDALLALSGLLVANVAFIISALYLDRCAGTWYNIVRGTMAYYRALAYYTALPTQTISHATVGVKHRDHLHALHRDALCCACCGSGMHMRRFTVPSEGL